MSPERLFCHIGVGESGLMLGFNLFHSQPFISQVGSSVSFIKSCLVPLEYGELLPTLGLFLKVCRGDCLKPFIYHSVVLGRHVSSVNVTDEVDVFSVQG